MINLEGILCLYCVERRSYIYHAGREVANEATMQASLREHFGISCETYSPSEGSCDLFVPKNQRWISWNKIRSVAKANRWTYDVVLDGAQTRVRFMTGSPLWEYSTDPVSEVANVTIKHALDNGLFCPKSKSTRAVHIGTTESVHIEATPRCSTRVSRRLAEALLDRNGVLDIHLKRGIISVVYLAKNHQTFAVRWDERPQKPLKEAAAQSRIQRALAKILRNRRRAAAAIKSRARNDKGRAGKGERRVSSLQRREMQSAVCASVPEVSADGGSAESNL